MSIVWAAQLVFTRVEAAYSPRNRSGWQTVYKDASLSGGEVGAIVERIQSYQPHAPDTVRRQFFVLDSGAIVLSNSTPIDSHPEIVDRLRRPGAFIAHCLIFSQSEFRKVDYNPFIIFDRYHFLGDADAMVTVFGQATGIARREKIDVDCSWPGFSSGWSGIESHKLVVLATESLRSAEHVQFMGTADEVEEALRTLFFLLPRDKRLLCTFDTRIEMDAPTAKLYWAAGVSGLRTGRDYVEVDAARRQVMASVEESERGEDLYLHWLTRMISCRDFWAAMSLAPTMQELAAAFAEQRHLVRATLDEQACSAFVELHRHRVSKALRNAVVKMIGEAVASPFAAYLFEKCETRMLLDVAASQRVDPVELSPLACQWLIERRTQLERRAWKGLEALALKANDMRLLHLSATLSPRTDRRKRDVALANMSELTYHVALSQLMEPIPPKDFVTPAYLNHLVTDDRLKRSTDREFVELMRAILRVRGMDQIGPLAERVATLAERPLSKLEEMIGRSDQVSRRFVEAAHARRRELGQPRGLRKFRKRRSVVGRIPREE